MNRLAVNCFDWRPCTFVPMLYSNTARVTCTSGQPATHPLLYSNPAQVPAQVGSQLPVIDDSNTRSKESTQTKEVQAKKMSNSSAMTVHSPQASEKKMSS
mmetsp:Transcript_15944/g.43413  ORF Transcript_15944/g.43413 Transcript_15944/m.43413 type:complete len:100 (-) Transcript_15944:3213-3512(-)